MKCSRVFCLILWASIIFSTSLLFGAIPQMINYQGRLTTSVGLPVNDTTTLVFTICNDSLCTTQLWSESRSNVIIKDGLFDAILGSITPIPSVVFDGSVRFLSVSLDGTPVTRRLPLVSIGYAYKSINADTAAYAKAAAGEIDCSDCDSRFVNIKGPDSVYVTQGTAFSGKSIGSTTSSHRGVEGYASNAGSGTVYGGYFSTAETGTGAHTGAYGSAAGSSTESVYGFFGYASNSSGGIASGGNFIAANAGTGVHCGLSALANSASPSGAYGVNAEGVNTSSGPAAGGAFSANAGGTGTHYGVYSLSHGSSSATTYGIRSEADNTSTGNAYGGYFRVPSSGTGVHYAVRGLSYGASSNDTYGSYMYSQNTSSGDATAGYFEVAESGTGSHTAVCGKAYHSDDISPSIGVYGYAENTGAGDAYGGYFAASGRDDGVDYAIYASAPLDTFNLSYAGWFDGPVVASGRLRVDGNLEVAGIKSAVVKTSGDKYRTVYCQESPENWFEDFGDGQLVNGHTHIDLDPVFLETVTIDAQHPMKVFVQLEGNCNGVYVEKGATGFDVNELKEGKGNVSFSYRVVAKRKGYEDLRLAEMRGPTPEATRARSAEIRARMEMSRSARETDSDATEMIDPASGKAKSADDEKQD